MRASGVDDVAAIPRPPLYRYSCDEGLGTVYTGPPVRGGAVTSVLPGERWEQPFGGFVPGARTPQ